MKRFVRDYLRRRGLGVDRLLIVGAGEVGRTVMRNIVAQPMLGYHIVGFVDDDPEKGSTDIGRFKALVLRVRKAIRRFAVKILRPTYRWIRKRLPSRLRIPARFRPRTVIFSSPDGGMKLTMGGRQIAHFDPLRDRWVLKRGARLFVDETKLPRPGDLAGHAPGPSKGQSAHPEF